MAPFIATLGKVHMSGGSSSRDRSSSFGLHQTPLWAQCHITAFPRRTTSSALLRPDRFANKFSKGAYAKNTQAGRSAVLSWWELNASLQTEHKSQSWGMQAPEPGEVRTYPAASDPKQVWLCSALRGCFHPVGRDKCFGMGQADISLGVRLHTWFCLHHGEPVALCNPKESNDSLGCSSFQVFHAFHRHASPCYEMPSLCGARCHVLYKN